VVEVSTAVDVEKVAAAAVGTEAVAVEAFSWRSISFSLDWTSLFKIFSM
jgi:hypothetical protein